ncbi:MAG TPA: hypothetical protein VHS99_17725 [Chloroflexota bacterium]|jgi:uncharacterized membrane protein YeaQ/YmgE (transglycosylase-associated protein family)|nr:hypothetical protein [Chloroflexota bacterium]
MLVYSWVFMGVVAGALGHLILRRRGYELIGEILVGIAGASIFGAYGPIVLGVRTGSVDILSDVGLLCTLVGALLAVGILVVLTPRESQGVAGQPRSGTDA